MAGIQKVLKNLGSKSIVPWNLRVRALLELPHLRKDEIVLESVEEIHQEAAYNGGI